MESGRESTSIKGSQTNVAESAQPLLETKGLGTPEKIDIQSTIPRGSSEKDVTETEEKQRMRSLTCMDGFTKSMNLLDRDAVHINDHVNVVIEEVLAEPRANQSFDQTWRLAYFLFAGTKFWVYRVMAAACAPPCGLLWGLIFSLISLASVWFITPSLKIIDILLQIVRRVWGGTVHAVLDPVFQSVNILIRGKKENESSNF